MTEPRVSAVSLRALEGEPLADAELARMVVATAHAIAERQGIVVRRLVTAPDRITVELETGRLEAIGFAAELRRVTSVWYTNKYGTATLWGDAPGDAADAWKDR